jgi:hypothetical protein
LKKKKKKRKQTCIFSRGGRKDRRKKRNNHHQQTVHQLLSRATLEGRGRGGASKNTAEDRDWTLSGVALFTQRAQTPPTCQQLFRINK